jgi:hypothetical protein
MEKLYIHFKSLDVPLLEGPPPPLSGQNIPLEEAKKELLAWVDSLGTYQTPGDRSRVIAVLITPMMVAKGHIPARACPPVKVMGPVGARERLIDVLNVLYGEEGAASGCKIL